MSELTVVAMPAQVEAEALTLSEQARGIIVQDQGSYDAAVSMLTRIRGMREKWAELTDPSIESAHKAHKTALELKNKVDRPLQAEEAALKMKIGRFAQAEEDKRQAEQRRLEAEATETARLTREALVKTYAEAGAPKDAVEALKQEPLSIAPVEQAQPGFQKSAAASVRTSYEAEVISLAVLVKAAAKNTAYLGYLQANQPALNAAARAQKEAMNVPGVRVKKDFGVAVKTK